jgi:hypothetical protein
MSIIEHYHAAWLDQAKNFDSAESTVCRCCKQTVQSHPVTHLATQALISHWVDLAELRGKGSGVYYLVLGEVVVYVGKTTAPETRIRAHICSGKQFDSVRWVAFDNAEEMHEFELSEISRLRPFYNSRSLSRKSKSNAERKFRPNNTFGHPAAMIWAAQGNPDLRSWILAKREEGFSYRAIATEVSSACQYPISHEWVRQAVFAWRADVK